MAKKRTLKQRVKRLEKQVKRKPKGWTETSSHTVTPTSPVVERDVG